MTKYYEVSEELIGNYYSRQEAEEALNSYEETTDDVFAYLIIGPEKWGSEDVFEEFLKAEADDSYEPESFDESPEYQLVYDAERRLVNSYKYGEYRKRNLQDEVKFCFKSGDKAWMLGSYYIEKEDKKVLVPVTILSKSLPQEYMIDIELVGFIVKPHLTLKANWGEYPEKEEQCSAIDLFPYNILKGVSQ